MAEMRTEAAGARGAWITAAGQVLAAHAGCVGSGCSSGADAPSACGADRDAGRHAQLNERSAVSCVAWSATPDFLLELRHGIDDTPFMGASTVLPIGERWCVAPALRGMDGRCRQGSP